MRLGYDIVFAERGQEHRSTNVRLALTNCFVNKSGQYAEIETGGTALAFTEEAYVGKTNNNFKANRATNEPAGSETAFVTNDIEAAYEKVLKADAVSAAVLHTKP